MTLSSIETRAVDRPAPATDRLGQATAVEQARAVAEVQAAIVVARQCPRDLVNARRQMLESCGQMTLAERAFFRFPRAGQTVSGPSIHIARELARCFGNIQYGVSELRRDDEHGQSEMQAWAWDVENNTRTASVFIVPHRRDTRTGQIALVDQRDIYENNANNGARRVREAIFAILPPWFVQEALAACEKTLQDGGGEPLPQRISKAVEAFAGLGVTEQQLVERVGRGTAQWTPHDIASLLVVFQSISRGEVSREDEFPTPHVTASEIKDGGSGRRRRASEPAAEEQPTSEDTGAGWPPVAEVPGSDE